MKILSKIDDLSKFFSSLSEGDIFGFSSSFTQAAVIYQAARHGLKVTPPAKTTPERKQFGEYVLKVRSIYKKEETSRIGLEDISYRTETAKGTRTCKDNKKHTIQKGVYCVVEVTPDILPNGNKIYKEKTYCLNCGVARLRAISRRLNMYVEKITGLL
jgi:hypothetical protein